MRARLEPEDIEQLKKRLFEDQLPIEQLSFEPVDALTLELRRFIESIRSPQARLEARTAGRDAVALAEDIVEQIAQHAWDDSLLGPVGPHALPPASLIPEPNFDAAPASVPWRKAG